MEPENEIWFYEKLTGMFVKTTMSKLKWCVTECYYNILSGGWISLSEVLSSLYAEIPPIVKMYNPCVWSDYAFGWNGEWMDNLPTIERSTKESCDGKPVFEINFHCDPK